GSSTSTTLGSAPREVPNRTPRSPPNARRRRSCWRKGSREAAALGPGCHGNASVDRTTHARSGGAGARGDCRGEERVGAGLRGAEEELRGARAASAGPYDELAGR